MDEKECPNDDSLPEEEEDKVFKNNVNQSVRMFMEGPTIRGRLERGVAAYTVSTICRAQGKMGKTLAKCTALPTFCRALFTFRN